MYFCKQANPLPHDYVRSFRPMCFIGQENSHAGYLRKHKFTATFYQSGYIVTRIRSLQLFHTNEGNLQG
ncbi:hypothetical protein Nepgr_019627 [Nepenthes gracilis]|uniref:Uncharacterized protein n=1 Tax=Nepenthes gracilis TaxID=150966 RepID=A0AAD3SVM8_NEPGR|nr:hypothetical protein Nepgr_019627 [Nepenthes gracilis]